MRADAVVQEREPPRSRTGTGDEARIGELIAELVNAGLVSTEAGDDGAIWFALTSAGEKVARQMAMRRDAHALILLGALVGSNKPPN